MIKKMTTDHGPRTTDQYHDLLIEIGTEEMPPKLLAGLAEDFSVRLTSLIKDIHRLWGKKSEAVKWYCSPRRLAVVFGNLPTRQPDRQVERFGPAITVAFDASGKPTFAAEGFARSCGATVDQLEQKDGKLFYTALQ